MIFFNSDYFLFLLLIPVFIFIFMGRLKGNQSKLQLYMSDICSQANLPSTGIYRKSVRFFCLLMMFSFLVLALARPQSPDRKKAQNIEVKSIEVMILMDVSKSMLVEDMGGLSRINVMKKELEKLIITLGGYRIGLISFSGTAKLISPLTMDHSLLKLLVKTVSPGAHQIQGTDFGGAFRQAVRALTKGSFVADPASTKVIVVASDGEDNEKQAVSMAKELAKKKIRTFNLGFGTSKGGMIPEYDFAGNKTGYKKDLEGELVISRFNSVLLRNIAGITGGAFYPVSIGGSVMEEVSSAIQSIRADTTSQQVHNTREEKYQWFLIISFLFGFLYFLIIEKSDKLLKPWHSYLEKVSK